MTQSCFKVAIPTRQSRLSATPSIICHWPTSSSLGLCLSYQCYCWCTSKPSLPPPFLLPPSLPHPSWCVQCMYLSWHRMGQAYNESNLQLSRRQNVNYCNKLFSSWEFSITDENSAGLRKAQIKREFEVQSACVCMWLPRLSVTATGSYISVV